jgi:hypothetical protein
VSIFRKALSTDDLTESRSSGSHISLIWLSVTTGSDAVPPEAYEYQIQPAAAIAAKTAQHILRMKNLTYFQSVILKQSVIKLSEK